LHEIAGGPTSEKGMSPKEQVAEPTAQALRSRVDRVEEMSAL
jgi:hypothetical protein